LRAPDHRAPLLGVKKFRARFLSVSAFALDSRVEPFQDREHSLEAITEICNRFTVRASIFGEKGQLLAEVQPDRRRGAKWLRKGDVASDPTTSRTRTAS